MEVLRTLAFLCLISKAIAGKGMWVEDKVVDEVRDDVDWWENGVFYQIYPRSFMDSSGDGTGDLKGITSKLQHLKDLGVTGTWLSPIFDSPMIDGGYDIRDYRKVNDMYGSNADLVELFKEAKRLDLKVILDFVPNHSSNQHEWFHKSANSEKGYEDYYVWRDCPIINGERVLPNEWIAVFNGPMWTFDLRRNQCYLHQFTRQQPDINFRMEGGKMQKEMMDILTFWMDLGADGFRVDAINHLFESPSFTNQKMLNPNLDPNLYSSYETTYTRDLDESYYFIHEARKHLDTYSKSKGNVSRILMTEAYASVAQQTRWYGEGEKRGSHIPFNFGFIADITKDSKAEDFKKVVDEWMEHLPSFAYGQANWVLGNHDRPRIASRFGENRHESLVVMSMMLPGVAIVYYGEEIGMTDNNKITWEQTEDPQACQSNRSVFKEFSRDPVRTPMQWDDSPFGGFCSNCKKTWLPVNENYQQINVKSQANDKNSTLQLYKNLIALRKEKDVLKFGGISTKVLGDGEIFAFERTIKDHRTIAVLVNIGGNNKTVNLIELFKEGDVTSKTKATVLITNNKARLEKGTVISNLKSISLGEYDAVVFEMSSAMRVAATSLYFVAGFWVFVKILIL